MNALPTLTIPAPHSLQIDHCDGFEFVRHNGRTVRACTSLPEATEFRGKCVERIMARIERAALRDAGAA